MPHILVQHCHVNTGLNRTNLIQRFILAWRTFRGPSSVSYAIYYNLESKSAHVLVGPGGSVDVMPGGRIVLEEGCVIRDRIGGGFVIEAPESVNVDT